MTRIGLRSLIRVAVIVLAALSVASVAGVFVLEESAGVRDGSLVLLLAVALVAYVHGSWAAVATALGAFLTYNFIFLPPSSRSSCPILSIF